MFSRYLNERWDVARLQSSAVVSFFRIKDHLLRALHVIEFSVDEPVDVYTTVTIIQIVILETFYFV